MNKISKIIALVAILIGSFAPIFCGAQSLQIMEICIGSDLQKIAVLDTDAQDESFAQSCALCFAAHSAGNLNPVSPQFVTVSHFDLQPSTVKQYTEILSQQNIPYLHGRGPPVFL